MGILTPWIKPKCYYLDMKYGEGMQIWDFNPGVVRPASCEVGSTPSYSRQTRNSYIKLVVHQYEKRVVEQAIKTLDLHGERHADVSLLVEDWVLRNSFPKDMPLKIICGNSNTMIRLVEAVLDKHDITSRQWQYGVIVIDSVQGFIDAYQDHKTDIRGTVSVLLGDGQSWQSVSSKSVLY